MKYQSIKNNYKSINVNKYKIFSRDIEQTLFAELC